MKNINKKGISLIVLIITIIVVIILAAVVILTLSKNNPIESAKEAAFKEDIRAYQDELNMYITKEYQSLAGQRDSKITATGYEKDSTSEEYNNSVYKYLSSFKKKYENKIAIENDEIVYIGRDKKEREWTNNIVKMNPMLTVKYVFENGEEAAPTYEETITDGAYEVDSPIIDGYEPDHYTVSDKIDKDTEITVTYYPWSDNLNYIGFDVNGNETNNSNEIVSYAIGDNKNFNSEVLIIPKKHNSIDVNLIKSGAFAGNNTIKKVIIPSTIKKLERSIFETCKNIEYVYVDAENIVGWNTFSISGLKTVYIGENVKYMDNAPFFVSNNLTEVWIYSENTEINAQHFCGSNNLEKLNVNKSNSKYTSLDGIVFSKDKKKIYAYPVGKKGNYTIPDEVEEIGRFAFYANKYINKVEIKKNVNKILDRAFGFCTNLEYVDIDAKQIEAWGVFESANLKTVIIGTNTKRMVSATFLNCNQLFQVNYLGSIEQWNQVSKNGWNQNSSITKVICTDGEIEL